jgi:hypothetical protein
MVCELQRELTQDSIGFAYKQQSGDVYSAMCRSCAVLTSSWRQAQHAV